jgi:hypothetical protein
VRAPAPASAANPTAAARRGRRAAAEVPCARGGRAHRELGAAGQEVREQPVFAVQGTLPQCSWSGAPRCAAELSGPDLGRSGAASLVSEGSLAGAQRSGWQGAAARQVAWPCADGSRGARRDAAPGGAVTRGSTSRRPATFLSCDTAAAPYGAAGEASRGESPPRGRRRQARGRARSCPRQQRQWRLQWHSRN